MSKKKISPSQAWREARELIWTHRRRLALGLLLMLAGRAASLVLPATSKFLIDDVIAKKRGEMLPLLAAAVAAAALIQAATTFGLTRVLGVAAQRAITDMRKHVQEKVMRLPIRYYDSTQTGILVSRVMNDAEGVRNLVGTGLVQLAGGVVTAVAAMGVLLYLNWRITLINVVILAAFGAVMAIAFKRLRPMFRQRWQIEGEVTGRLTQTLGGARVIKAYTAEAREHLVFTRGVHRLFRVVARTMIGTSGVMSIGTVVMGVIGVLMITLGGRAILSGEMTLGEFVMYLAFTGMLAAPLVQLASIGTQITEAFAGLDRIREILHMEDEDGGKTNLVSLAKIRGDVTFDHVHFEYNPGVPVLRDISFHARAGSTTALVGSSGSGKSTLTSLIMAFHQPLSGRILIDERDLASVALREYRSNLGIVLQDDFLFDGTIAENIAFSSPHASFDEVRRAARVAHCEEFVMGFEKQYDTIVGERGVKLSGGQRQRASIARAILANPSILILDEATSSLDSESEALIQDGLKALRRGRTTFVIAHRLSTIESADQILVLERGQIVERGTHHELMARDGRYRELHDKQYRLETDRYVNPGEDFTPEPEKVAARDRGDSDRMPVL